MTMSPPKKFESLKSSWYLWLFPAFALILSAWLLYDYNKEQGPRIVILFDEASGIQVEKTKVRFRGVTVGTVKDIYISEDQQDVVVEVLLRANAAHFAVQGTKFSLVTPKVGFQGISGLETFFEGTYIAVLPGTKDSKEKFEFNAQINSATETHDDTSVFLLETSNVESLSAGDSVTYRGVKVGTISKLNFVKGGQSIILQINIENRFSYLIRDNTVFWSKVGIQAKLGLFGSEIKVNSMDSIMNGGIEFATPTEASPRAKNFQKFSLSPIAVKDASKWKPFLD